jgi:signal transduction histidine kinase/ActR/RegA family two-component response regulator
MPPIDLARKKLPSRTQYLLELVCRTAGAAHGGIGLVSAEGEPAEHLVHDIRPEVEVELRRSGWVRELFRVLLDMPGPTAVADIAALSERLAAPPGLPPLGPLLSVPLSLPGRWRGGLYLLRPAGAPPFDAADLETILPARGWLEEGSMFEEAHLLAQLRLLTQVAQAAAGSLDLSCMLAIALRELDRQLPLHVCAVWLADGGGFQPLPEHPAAPPVPQQGDHLVLSLADVSAASRERAATLGLTSGLRLPLHETPFTPCVRDGQPLYADWNGPSQPAPPARASSSCFAVPLRAGDQTVGVLQSVYTGASGFTREQIQLLYLVADLLGPAISSCQLFERLHNAYEQLRVTHTHLIHVEKMRAMGELASGMAHEFNNSLCGALGFLDLALLGSNLDPTCRGYLESTRTCALDAAQTVRRVQDFARKQREDLTARLVDVNELVRQTLELTRHKWEGLSHARGLPITVEVRTEAQAPVQGCPTELREVLTNLIFNAIDAMPAGGALRLRAWGGAPHVFVSVADTGGGIPAAVRHRLFEPFFTTKGERGNGLGLTVVADIVRRHRGEIRVESEAGQGSVFTVKLPAAGGRPAPPAPPPPEEQGVNRSLNVLIVEDEPCVRDFLGQVLTRLGHRHHLATCGREALDTLDREQFDVVLTDLGLPDLSGEQVARAAAQRCPQTPVVLLTGWADQIRAESLAIQGVSQVLAKPVSIDTLARTLAKVAAAGRPSARGDQPGPAAGVG